VLRWRKYASSQPPFDAERMPDVADNTEKIAELDAVLQAGTKSTMVDGVSVTIDLEAIRRERDRLIAADDMRASDRPRVVGFNLGSF